MVKSSIIEINSTMLESNIQFLQHHFGEEVRISSVVKGNAYGHGIEVVVPIIRNCGIDHFSVFNSDEARRVHSVVNGDATIMIMGFIADEDLDWVLENEIEFFISDILRANRVIDAYNRIKKKAHIHIEIETGLNRTGLDFESLKILADIIKKHPDIFHTKGLCTHYAGAESIANYVRIQHQIKTYNEILAWLNQQKIYPEIRHTACSAAAMTYPETRMDLMRIGILQYGFWPSKETFIHYIHNRKQKNDPLKRVIQWKTKVMAVKKIKQGEFIGYGNNFQAYNNMKIAVIPVGYCDGYSRTLSNRGKILINNERIAIIGMVNMNMILANVSKLPNVSPGDEVVIVGKQGNHQLSVASFSELSNQVNYELLTRLPQHIKRIKTV